ncbi:MAG TPA: histone deacetylase [Steroidobacteraceae bacterium]|nr:histone deacetylase [Steroidobacteraceae bacterium]
MRVSFHPDYRVDLPPTHPYPMGKYPLLYARLIERGLIAADDVMQPEEAPLELLARVHTPDYLARLAGDALTPAERRRLGVPFTPRLWRRARLAAHGTWLAARAALADGLAGNLAGGTHHAFADHGEGFCVLNDVAIAVHALRADGGPARALIVDLDVHQGNGTASIFAADPEVYTLSLHGARNYPVRKERSSRDVELPDGTGDDAYLAALAAALAEALAAARPQIAFLIAGVDVVAGDRYGRLALSESGLRRRERLAIATLRDAGCPLAIVLGGGYAASTLRTAELHALVFEEAVGRWRAERGR